MQQAHSVRTSQRRKHQGEKRVSRRFRILLLLWWALVVMFTMARVSTSLYHCRLLCIEESGFCRMISRTRGASSSSPPDAFLGYAAAQESSLSLSTETEDNAVTTSDEAMPTTTTSPSNGTAPSFTDATNTPSAAVSGGQTTAPIVTAFTPSPTTVRPIPTLAPDGDRAVRYPPGEVPVRWSYSEQSAWGSLAPLTRACVGGAAANNQIGGAASGSTAVDRQSPIALGLSPEASQRGGVGGAGLSASSAAVYASPAPTRVVGGFGPIFQQCGFSQQRDGARGWVYQIRRLQQTFTLTPLPNGVPIGQQQQYQQRSMRRADTSDASEQQDSSAFDRVVEAVKARQAQQSDLKGRAKEDWGGNVATGILVRSGGGAHTARAHDFAPQQQVDSNATGNKEEEMSSTSSGADEFTSDATAVATPTAVSQTVTTNSPNSPTPSTTAATASSSPPASSSSPSPSPTAPFSPIAPLRFTKTCRMIKPDGSLWLLSHMTPHTRSEHSINGYHYPMSIDFVFRRRGSIVPSRQPKPTAAQQQQYLNNASVSQQWWGWSDEAVAEEEALINSRRAPTTQLEGYNITIVSIMLSDASGMPNSDFVVVDASDASSGAAAAAGSSSSDGTNPEAASSSSSAAAATKLGEAATPPLVAGAGLGAFIDDAMQKLNVFSVGASTDTAELENPDLLYTFVNSDLDLLDAVFSNSAFFSYGGSLTTPPCTEGVSWLVSSRVVRIGPLTAQLLIDANIRSFGVAAGGRDQRVIRSRAGNGEGGNSDKFSSPTVPATLYFTGTEGSNAPMYAMLVRSMNSALSSTLTSAMATIALCFVAFFVA